MNTHIAAFVYGHIKYIPLISDALCKYMLIYDLFLVWMQLVCLKFSKMDEIKNYLSLKLYISPIVELTLLQKEFLKSNK